MDSGPPLTSWANVTENGDGNVTSEMGDDDSCLERTWFNSDQLAGELNLCPSPSNSTEDDFNTFYFYQVRTRQMQSRNNFSFTSVYSAAAHHLNSC